MSEAEQEIYEYSIPNRSLASLRIQPGFVEGVTANGSTFSNLSDALEHLFQNNLEFAIISWNGIPFQLDYQKDIPQLIDGMCPILVSLLQFSEETMTFNMKTPNNGFIWEFQLNNEVVTINGTFERLKGGQENVLNELSLLKMDLYEFMAEWKLLFEQIIHAIEDSQITITSEAALQKVRNIAQLCDRIPNRALRYRYDLRS